MLRSIGQNPTEDEILGLVIEYDVNGDGTIDFDEFIQMMSKVINNMDLILVTLEIIFDILRISYISSDTNVYIVILAHSGNGGPNR